MKEETYVVSCRIPLSQAKELEKIAEKRKMSRSELTRIVIDLGLEAHKDLDRLGIIGVADLVYFVRKSLEEKCRSKQIILT